MPTLSISTWEPPCRTHRSEDNVLVSATVQRRDITDHCSPQDVVLFTGTLLAFYRVVVLKANQWMSVTCMVYTCRQ